MELSFYMSNSPVIDQERIMAKANEIIEKEIGAHLNLILVGGSQYQEKMNLMINTGDAWDLCFTANWFDFYNHAGKGAYADLTDLFRASSSPEMRADNRVHRFAYAFTAWGGSFLDSNVVQQGYELNVRLQISRGSIKAFSAVSIDKTNVILDTMKPAEDGNRDIILRFYESKKAAVMTKVHCTLCKQAYLCHIVK